MRASSTTLPESEAIEHLASVAAGEVEIDAAIVRVRPRSVEGARRAIAAAAERGLRFEEGGLVLDRSGLCHVGLVDPRAMWIHCGAGAPLRAVERSLTRAGLTLGSQPPSIFEGTVADWLEGPYAGRRAMDGRLEPGVAAIEAALPDGTALATRAAPRSAAGPAVAHLILGGGGACGHLLGATLKAQPVLRKREVVAIEGEGAKLAALLARTLRTQLLPWEVSLVGPSLLEVVWPIEREDQRVALQSLRRHGQEAGLQVLRRQLQEPSAGVETELPTAELQRIFAAVREGETFRFVRLSRESVVAVGPRQLPGGLRQGGDLLGRIAAALRAGGGR
ncbi:FAD-binding oxidoreductase [Vulgatibacter sp.]|uniref:FAD-binding oxidoreductase n=1 Tax=Vulgatibacter sp. TaxID=1971226 RepID=UPI003567E965